MIVCNQKLILILLFGAGWCSGQSIQLAPNMEGPGSKLISRNTFMICLQPFSYFCFLFAFKVMGDNLLIHALAYSLLVSVYSVNFHIIGYSHSVMHLKEMY